MSVELWHVPGKKRWAYIPLVQLEAVIIEPILCDLIYFFVIQFNIN
jgi:hypothetical protein